MRKISLRARRDKNERKNAINGEKPREYVLTKRPIYDNILKGMLKEKGLYLITDPATRLYFTGFASSAGFVIFVDKKKYFVVDARYHHAAKRKIKNGFEVVKGSYNDALAIMRDSGEKVLYIDFEKTTLSEGQKLTLAGYELRDCHEEIVGARSIKTDRELYLIKRACTIAENALKATLPYIKEGVTEKHIAAVLEMNFKVFGAEKPSFDSIVAFGANAAIPHHEPDDTALKRNSVVLIDFGCLYKGYCSDITRTFFFGKPNKEFKSAYNAVNAAFSAAFRNIRAGVSGVVADSYARDLLKQKGYGQYFTHSLGHGIGVDIHEDPYLSPKGEAALLDGAVFSIEPGVYLNDKFGIRIENTVTLKNGRVKSLVTLPRRLKLL